MALLLRTRGGHTEMQAAEARRAVAAAMSTASALDLAVDDAVVLSDSKRRVASGSGQDKGVIVAGSSEPELFRIAVQRFRGVSGDDRFLAAAGTLSYLALVDGELAGWCWGQHMIRPDQTSMIYLHELEVAEAYRRRGLGRALVQSVMDEGRDLGATKMFLTTGEANLAARALYEQLGAGLAARGPTVNYWFPLRS